MKLPTSSFLVSLIAVAGLMLGLAACSEPNTAWVKRGATADDLRAAQRDCARTASDFGFVDTQLYDSMARERSSSASGNEYRRCMESQGWRRERTDQGPPK